MKILFMDVDGVLNTQESFKKNPKVHFPIDPYCAFLVGKIQLDTDCKVVLSSSWRHHKESVAYINERVVPILDITGHCCSGIRGAEIYSWIEKNVPWDVRKEGGPFRYAILDDDSDMLMWQEEHFFKTSFTNGGLTKEIAEAVTSHLNRV